MAALFIPSTNESSRAQLEAQVEAYSSAFRAQLRALFGASTKPEQSKATPVGRVAHAGNSNADPARHFSGASD